MANESLDEALWEFVYVAFPANDYEKDCHADLAIVVGNNEWSTHAKNRLSDLDELNKTVVGDDDDDDEDDECAGPLKQVTTMKTWFCLLLFLLSTGAMSPAVCQEQDKYKLNPTADPTSNNKIYIPTNLDDAFAELKKMLHPDLLKEIKEGSERDMIQYHMGMGLWMRNNWGLWAGSRLAKYFNGIGIFHPDDMSGIILDSFWRHLNSQPIKLEEQVAYYQKYWKVNAEPKKKNCPLDGSLIEVTMSLDESEGDNLRAIHVGRCKKRKHLWAYEHDKGWYRPDSALRKKIEQ